MGGRRGGDAWMDNPQFKLTVESDTPVTVSVTLVEKAKSALGVFALDVRQNEV